VADDADELAELEALDKGKALKIRSATRPDRSRCLSEVLRWLADDRESGHSGRTTGNPLLVAEPPLRELTDVAYEAYVRGTAQRIIDRVWPKHRKVAPAATNRTDRGRPG
jgi:hypothetical protein